MHRARVGQAARVFLCVMVCAAAAASVPQPSRPPKQAPSTGDQPAVKVTSRLVEVNVIVLDKKGQPVRGLTRDDFEVFDENEAQAIRAFSVHGASAPTPNAPTPASAAPLPPNTFTNQAPRAIAGTLSVILFDELNTKIQDKLFARQRILRFLSQLRPEDRIAIYLLSDRLRVLHDFTGDATALTRIIQRQTGAATRRMENAELDTNTTGYELLDAFVEDAARKLNDEAIRNRVRRTLVAVEWISSHLAPVPGRKNLMWVSGGFPLTLGYDPRRPGDTSFREQDVFTVEVARATRAINRANIAVYPIDARGLFADPMDEGELRGNDANFLSGRSTLANDRFGGSPSDSQARDASAGNQQGAQQGPRRLVAPPRLPQPIATQSFRRLDATIDGMLQLAERTGGRAFYNSNDIQTALRSALEESEVNYRLAFEPTHNRWDGSFRQIKVRVRSEGLRARHRQGYLAQADTPPSDASQELMSLRETAASPIDLSDVALRAELIPLGNTDEFRVRVFVKSSDLLLNQGTNGWKGAVDVYFEMANQAGAPLWGDARRVEFTLTPQLHQLWLAQGVPLNKTAPRIKDATQLRIVVRDVRTGALGSLRVPLDEVR